MASSHTAVAARDRSAPSACPSVLHDHALRHVCTCNVVVLREEKQDAPRHIVPHMKLCLCPPGGVGLGAPRAAARVRLLTVEK